MSDFIPKGFQALTPYLSLHDTTGFVAFMGRAFGASERFMTMHDGRLMHGEIVVEGCVLEISEAREDSAPSGSHFHLFVEDPDAVYAQAIDAGATSVYPMADQPYGERSGGVRDPWGNQWYVARVTDHARRSPS